jgi:BMFP domain-containing protein YqiC
MAAKAREDSEALMAKVAALESELARLKGGV